MSFILTMPQLQHAAFVKTAILIWKSNCCIHLTDFTNSKYSTDEMSNHWPQFESKVCNQVSRLPLPKNLKQYLTLITKLTGLELHNWVVYIQQYNLSVVEHEADWSKLLNCIKYTEWTIHGKINAIKTAQALLLHNNALNQSERYEIACTYCLNNAIEYWNTDILDRWRLVHFLTDRLQLPLITTWTHMMLRGTEINMNKRIELFIFAIENRNERAVKYFWSLFTSAERDRYVISAITTLITRNTGTAITAFLLAQLREEQLQVLLEPHVISMIMLSHFLSDWVYANNFFRVIFDRVRGSYTNTHLYEVVIMLAEYSNELNGDTCKMLLTDVWINSSRDFKSYFITEETEGLGVHKSCCVLMCQSKDFYNLQLVFNGVAVADIRMILSKCFLWNDVNVDWNFLEFNARKYITSDEEMAIFKDVCAINAYKVCSDFDINDENQWLDINRFLNFCSLSENLKKNFVYFDYTMEKLLQGLVNNGGDQLELIDRFLLWANLSENEMKKFKGEFIEFIKLYLQDLLCNEQFEFLDRILSWCALTPEELIALKKEKLANSDLCTHVFFKSICNGNIESVNRCLSWCFDSQDEVNAYKSRFTL